MGKYTTKDFERDFPSDDVCMDWLFNTRYPEGVHCPKCDKVTKHHRIKARSSYSCDICGSQVYPTAGTIFHKSSTPLKVWFQVMYRMASTRYDISAKQIQRETGVTYKTAWRMFKQIRSLLNEDCGTVKGEVKADETYIGGKRSGTRGHGAEGKTPVIGIAQRHGKIIASVSPDVSSKTITPFIAQNMASESTAYDEFRSYNNVSKAGYKHRIVKHGREQWVDGLAHINTIESFWSLMKRGIEGVYHAVSPKHLQSYVNEYSFRYNHRNDETPMFQFLLGKLV
ncbi:MAG: transposase IS1595 [Dehalococcoides mccartyi]|uniref:IS1595 family transposase n=1 Tax=Dehalococcoides mccartyi TaxID=61435 RepID=UPI00242CF012|nr:IS1595 family transposase [Dehalococcoides mccartyi]MCF7635288.1 transposase IS1595 [Dehalococcoides mccartyi]MEA2122209.1 IS1595 family transposase ISSpo3 [Dehalococcoides mccartyi]